jgi:hypothetical protein
MVPLIPNLGTDGVSGEFYFPITLTSGTDPHIPIELEDRWTPGPVWAFWKTDNCLSLSGIETRFVGRRARSLVTVPVGGVATTGFKRLAG